MNTELKYKQTKNFEESETGIKTMEFYESDYYVLRINNYNAFRLFDIRRKTEEDGIGEVKLPTIYFANDDMDENTENIRIQTASYGALSTEEIKQVVKGYEIALMTVEEIKKAISENN